MSSDMRRGIGSCGIRNIPWHSISTVESRSDYVMKTGQRLVSFPCRGPQRVQAVFHSFSTMSNLAYSPDLPHYVPFEAGDFVDYYSASTSSWIPAKAVKDHEMAWNDMKWPNMFAVCHLNNERFPVEVLAHRADGLYDLDCKSGVAGLWVEKMGLGWHQASGQCGVHGGWHANSRQFHPI